MHIYPIDFFNKDTSNPMGKGQSFEHMVLVQLDIYTEKNEPWPSPYAIHKY